MNETKRWRIHLGDLAWLVLYLAMLGMVIGGMYRARRYALADFSSAVAQERWTFWREAVKSDQAQSTSVQRKMPRSNEPPTLVLLRDHFTACLLVGIVLSSLLFASVLFLTRAALQAPAFVPHED